MIKSLTLIVIVGWFLGGSFLLFGRGQDQDFKNQGNFYHFCQNFLWSSHTFWRPRWWFFRSRSDFLKITAHFHWSHFYQAFVRLFCSTPFTEPYIFSWSLFTFYQPFQKINKTLPLFIKKLKPTTTLLYQKINSLKPHDTKPTPNSLINPL